MQTVVLPAAACPCERWVWPGLVCLRLTACQLAMLRHRPPQQIYSPFAPAPRLKLAHPSADMGATATWCCW
jgi:hypothetical protein